MWKSNQRGLNRGGAPHRGRVQRAAVRLSHLQSVLSTADVCAIAYCRKMLLHGRRLDPQDYRMARKALALIAAPTD